MLLSPSYTYLSARRLNICGLGKPLKMGMQKRSTRAVLVFVPKGFPQYRDSISLRGNLTKEMKMTES